MDYVLYHHGVKGMKWGVRRYQNKDGSLTDAGKKRLTEGLQKNFKKAAKKNPYSASAKYQDDVKDAANRGLTIADKKQVLDAREKAMDAYNKRMDAELAQLELDDLGESYALDYYNKRFDEAPDKYADDNANEKLMLFALNYGAGKAKREHPDLVKVIDDYEKNANAYDKCADEYVKACKDASDKLLGEYGNAKLYELEPTSPTVKESIFNTIASMDFDLSEGKKRKR